MDALQADDDRPAAPVRRRGLRPTDPIIESRAWAPQCILVLGLSALLFTPTVGPLALLLSPIAALWGYTYVGRERSKGREPSSMAVTGRNLGMLVTLPVSVVLAFAIAFSTVVG